MVVPDLGPNCLQRLSADDKINLFPKKFPGTLLECQRGWDPDQDRCSVSPQVSVRTVCKVYQQTTKFSKLTFSKYSLWNIIKVSNGLDPDQDQHSVGPELGPNCLQRLSADSNSCR